jgi:branched-chain amino acid transport system ATP-binding protein
MLQVQGLEAAYGSSQVLFGMAFEVPEGHVATLIGRNGMGKSTTIKSLMGMITPSGGSIKFCGTDIAGWPSFRVGQAGIGLVPEGRHVFPNLSVKENLVATAHNKHGAKGPWTLESVYQLFPRLKERERNLGSNLSGGEQQMLAIGRALMTNPKLLVLDEATEGLAPLIRKEIWECLARLKARGQTAIVIDKNIGPLLKLADHHYVVEKGKVVWHGDSRTLAANPDVLHKYLGV